MKSKTVFSKYVNKWAKFSFFLLVCCTALAGSVTKPNTFSSGEVISSSKVNSNFDTLFTEMNKFGTAITPLANGNVGIGLANPAYKLDVAGGIAVNGRIAPWHWDADSVGDINFGNAGWMDIPGTTITYVLPSNADVRISFDGSIAANTSGVHCNLGFNMDGTLMGQASYGDQITMAVNGHHWKPVSRHRWVNNQSAGSHTLKIQGNSVGGSATNCFIPDYDYGRLRVEVVAYPR